MRSAAECNAKAAELSRQAEIALDAETRATLIDMAAEWARLAITSEWQDALKVRFDP